jgi:triosephosphate isomerase
VFDFRPYHIGADIRKSVEIPEDQRPEFENIIVYERNGEKLELGLDDDDPDSTWNYVETKRIMTKEGGKSLISDFYIIDKDGEDIAQYILDEEGYNFLLIAPVLENANQGYIGDINAIYDYAKENGYGFYCIKASDTTAQKYWTEHTGAEYEYFMGVERALKTIVRSNPGLVLLKDGKIITKRSTYDLPDDHILSDRLENIDFGKSDIVTFKRKIAYILLTFILPLLLLTVIDRLAAGWSFYRNIKRRSKDFQLENIERVLGLEKAEEKDTNNNN